MRDGKAGTVCVASGHVQGHRQPRQRHASLVVGGFAGHHGGQVGIGNACLAPVQAGVARAQKVNSKSDKDTKRRSTQTI